MGVDLVTELATRTEGYSGRVIKMLCQLVGVFSVERARILLTRFFN